MFSVMGLKHWGITHQTVFYENSADYLEKQEN